MIREFVKGDEIAIAGLEQECFADPWSKEAVLESAESGVLFLLFEEKGEILGYAGMQIVLDEGYVTNVAVNRNHRKKGIGNALVKGLISAARERELSFVSLEVRPSNTAAISLYSKLGFAEVGRRKNFYSHPTEDGLIMTLEGF